MKNFFKINTKNILVVIANIIFVLLYLILSYYNRFAVDDYYHIHDEQLFGIWGGMLEGYYNWGGRWTSYLLWDVIYHFNENKFILFIYSFSLIILFVTSIYLFLKNIFQLFSITITKIKILNYSLLFTSFVFLISFSKGEIWFWVQSTTMFLLSLTLFIIGLSVIINKKKNFIHYLILAICFTYAGGASETYALFYMIFLISLLFCFYIFRKIELLKLLKNNSLIKIYISLIFLIISFIISIKAHGNTIRATWLPEPSLIDSFYITFKSLAKLIIFKISQQVPWIILFSFPFIYLGFISKNNQKPNNTNDCFKTKHLKYFIISFISLIVLIYFLLFPACYILSEIGPDRSLSQIVFIIGAFCAVWAFTIGYKLSINKKLISILNIISLVTIILSLTIISYNQFKIASEYAAKLDKRTNLLLNLQNKGNKKTITLEKLSPAGFLYSAEISSDTNYFGNDHYKRGLLLDFKVKSNVNKK